MRMIVFFDIPTGNLEEKRIASNFRKFLIKDGYTMLQYSVYARVCNGTSGLKTHYARLRSNLPDIGSVKLLTLTEEQFAGIETLVGDVGEQWSSDDVRTAIF